MIRRAHVSEQAPIELPTVRIHLFDPAPELALLREERPICRLRYPDGHLGWLITSYDLARELLVDPRFSLHPFRTAIQDPFKFEDFRGEDKDLLDRTKAGNLLFLDAPEHTRVRRVLVPFFTVRRIEALRPRVERIVSARLDAMEQSGPPADFVETFALPVPSMAICDWLGVPHSDEVQFQRPTDTLQDPSASAGAKIATRREFLDYATGVIAHKRGEPADDLLSELIATGDLTDDELAGIAMMVFAAGHKTTATMLALSAFVLLSSRGCWEELRTDPSLMQPAVEELLRYLTISQVGATPRTALEDVELGGTTIQAGETVTVSLAAANRDPDKFADPDRFHLSRDASGHLAFAHGRHMCLGQHLARLEVEVGLTGLLQRFPTLDLAVPCQEIPVHGGDQFLYGVHKLPVIW
jgi:cytochrome P450